MPTVADDVDERPLICNAFSVNGILDGRKTQTRRIAGQDFRMQKAERVNRGSDYTFDFIFEDDTGMLRESPYGEPGDILWVREAFRLPVSYDNVSPSEYVDSDLPLTVRFEADGGQPVENSFEGDSWGRKRPSIHMPRELCRLRLRVEDVRVEKVQQITPKDAQAEGIELRYEPTMPDGEPEPLNPVGGFKKLWNDIHGPDAWGRNEWVWCISFTRIDDDH